MKNNKIKMKYPIRINKYLRDKNLASRREADKLIEEGLILINGKYAKKGALIREEDNVEIKKIRKDYQTLAYYKPRGLSTQDLPKRESVITKWKGKGLYPIGRLDKESEGLLLLTNDGRLAREVLSQKEKYEKEYIVSLREVVRPSLMQILKKGMKTKTFGRLLPAKAEIIDKKTIKIILREGKRHQIRVMLSELSYNIISLKRVRIGNIEIGSLKPGETRAVKPDIDAK